MATAERITEKPISPEISKETFFDRIGRPELKEILTPQTPWVSVSMEVGLSDLSYAGGLGILKGDHALQAEKLRIPTCFLFPLYSETWDQIIDQDFFQREVNYALPFPRGFVQLEPEKSVIIKANKHHLVKVDNYTRKQGEVSLHGIYHPSLGWLYKGEPGSDHRLYQQALLGFGGLKHLVNLGKDPAVIQLEESATASFMVAFLDFLCQKEKTLKEASKLLKEKMIFTNHSLVPAAAATYSLDQVERYLLVNMKNEEVKQQLRNLAASDNGFLNSARLILELVERANGVSWIHAITATERFKKEFQPVTNGIYLERWTFPSFLRLYQESGLIDEFDLPTENYFLRIESLDEEKMWLTKREARKGLNLFLENRFDQYGSPINIPPGEMIALWARRFTDYKRPGMPLEDPARLAEILEKTKMHLIIAGKVHPDPLENNGMKRKLQEILKMVDSHPGLRKRVHFVVNYDEEVARALMQGSDIFINTPKVGEEGCQTSGMKAGVNGAILVSTPDGWFAEIPASAYFVIEQGSYQEEVASLYRQLEAAAEIIQNPRQWADHVKKQLTVVLPIASGARMLRDYLNFALPKEEVRST